MSQHQPWPSTILSTLELLNSLDRVERSFNAIDNITNVRSTEVANLNLRFAFINNPITASTYLNHMTLMFSIASTIGNLTLPKDLLKLPKTEKLEFLLHTWNATFAVDFWKSFGIKDTGLRY